MSDPVTMPDLLEKLGDVEERLDQLVTGLDDIRGLIDEVLTREVGRAAQELIDGDPV